MDDRPHVVIVGGGFGGLEAARALKKASVRVTLVDRTNHHLFQPLLYQVAMAGLSPADIAAPIRHILHNVKNCETLLGEVTAIDLAARRLCVDRADGDHAWLQFDYLVLAAGARTAWFGRDHWAKSAVGLKDLDEAVEIRRRVLVALEAAEAEDEPENRRRLLNFVVIGGGPTGVEVAGALAELGRFILGRDFHHVRPEELRVVLLEGGPRLLAAFPEKLSDYAVERLRRLGVDVRLGALVSDIRPDGVQVGDEFIPSSTVVWAAGVAASPLTRDLGVPLDRGGRVVVEPDCSLPAHPHAFAIGDIAAYTHTDDGRPLPGVSPVALQQARFVARQIVGDLRKQPRGRFRYLDKGSMATIGRSAAVAMVGRFTFTGFFAWLVWLAVHIFFLIGFRNRLMVMINWAWNYFTYNRGARLITGHRLHAGPPAAWPHPHPHEHATDGGEPGSP